jgi:hypothetical protein
MDVRQQPRSSALDLALGMGGGVLGGWLGFWLFAWLFRQGFYALALPGTLIGLGCGLAIRRRRLWLAGLCGLGGLGLGIYTEWTFVPFLANTSLAYFLAHLHELRALTLIMIALGGALSFYFALGRKRATRPSQ